MTAAPLPPRPVHIWIADYESGKGGIQVFTQFLIRAVGEVLPGTPLVVLSKNDRSFSNLPQRSPPTRLFCSGWWPQRLRTVAFSARLLCSALADRPQLILSTHVNFTPVAAWIQRLSGAIGRAAC